MLSISKSEICCAIVTYGDRFDYLSRVLDQLIKQGAKKIVVVNNNSVIETKQGLDKYITEYGDLFRVINLDDNLGSSGGYTLALRAALEQTSANYLWLLDDDNEPLADSFDAVIKSYQVLSSVMEKIALVSYRKVVSNNSQIKHKDILYDSVFKGKVLGKPEAIVRKLLLPAREGEIYPFIERYFASFGGLFMSRDLVELIGFPREDFFLYADDTEYSIRMRDNGYRIFTCYPSQVLDIVSQHSTVSYLSRSANDRQVYYSIRNHLYVNSMTSKFSYIKQYIKLLILISFRFKYFIFDTRFFVNRVQIILRAIKDGRKGRLGKVI